MSTQIRSIAAFLICATFIAWASSAIANSENLNYKLSSTLHLDGPTHWDYLAFDPDHQRLFITRSERVDVLDMATKKLIGSIRVTDGVHGVSLAPDLGIGFTSNGKANTSTVFDLTTLQPVTTIKTGNKPDALVYDAATQRVFVADADSDDVTVIDAKKMEVIGTIKLDGHPEYMVLDNSGRLYINIENKSRITVVDTKALKVFSDYSLAPNCDGPTGLSIDIIQRRLFSSCANQVLLVVDVDTGKIIDTLPIGKHSDASLFDPVTKLAFSSNGDGTVTVVGASGARHYSVVQTVNTMVTARTMALNPSTHQIYLAAAETEGFDPPTDKHPEPRPHIKPDTFVILTLSPSQ